MARRGRKAPVTSVPEIKKLLKDGYKWNGNFHDEYAPSQVENLLSHYEEVITAQAYDRFGGKLEGELGIWVRKDKYSVDDILDSAVATAIDRIWEQRDILLSLRSKGIPVNLCIDIILSTDRKFLPLLQEFNQHNS